MLSITSYWRPVYLNILLKINILSLLLIQSFHYPPMGATVPSFSARQRVFTLSNSPRIQDIGTVMRAFLPVRDATERSRILDYYGIRTVVDTRVVCVRPRLIDVTFSTREGFHLIG
jgi:hypothetical protein